VERWYCLDGAGSFFGGSPTTRATTQSAPWPLQPTVDKAALVQPPWWRPSSASAGARHILVPK
jgi:hypothetical protein